MSSTVAVHRHPISHLPMHTVQPWCYRMVTVMVCTFTTTRWIEGCHSDVPVGIVEAIGWLVWKDDLVLTQRDGGRTWLQPRCWGKCTLNEIMFYLVFYSLFLTSSHFVGLGQSTVMSSLWTVDKVFGHRHFNWQDEVQWCILYELLTTCMDVVEQTLTDDSMVCRERQWFKQEGKTIFSDRSTWLSLQSSTEFRRETNCWGHIETMISFSVHLNSVQLW